MNTQVSRLYTTLRRDYVGRYTGSGENYHYKVPANATLAIAKLHFKVKELWEKYEDEGRVRLRIESDYGDYDNLVGDSFNPEANPDINPVNLKRQEKKFIDKCNREGVWGIIGEYTCSHCNTFLHGDSCWGFVGDEWKEAEDDIKAQTLKAAGLWNNIMYHWLAKESGKLVLFSSSHPPKESDDIVMYLRFSLETELAEMLLHRLWSKESALNRKADINEAIDSIIAHVFPEEA